mmetsp:Transcript_16684/g.55561  ORF Transcript_16684/g.55561 Transcript_16684/m.55561 type:complete len:213 (+) Transcript_16684:594-1232(+)
MRDGPRDVGRDCKEHLSRVGGYLFKSIFAPQHLDQPGRVDVAESNTRRSVHCPVHGEVEFEAETPRDVLDLPECRGALLDHHVFDPIPRPIVVVLEVCNDLVDLLDGRVDRDSSLHAPYPRFRPFPVVILLPVLVGKAGSEALEYRVQPAPPSQPQSLRRHEPRSQSLRVAAPNLHAQQGQGEESEILPRHRATTFSSGGQQAVHGPRGSSI